MCVCVRLCVCVCKCVIVISNRDDLEPVRSDSVHVVQDVAEFREENVAETCFVFSPT